jgi:hypothetical protein
MSTDVLDFQMNFEDGQQSEADKRLLVLFYRSTIKNEPKSVEAGRPIFDEIDLVKIITPGSRDSLVTDATYEYQQRFPTQWARYKAGQEQISSGTPLSQLPWMSIAQVEEFKAVGCQTIEQLVGMPDSISQKFMGHHQLKQRAQAYLDAAKGNAPTLQLQAELEKRDEQIAQLTTQVNALLAAQNAAKAAQAANKVPTKA